MADNALTKLLRLMQRGATDKTSIVIGILVRPDGSGRTTDATDGRVEWHRGGRLHWTNAGHGAKVLMEATEKIVAENAGGTEKPNG